MTKEEIKKLSDRLKLERRYTAAMRIRRKIYNGLKLQHYNHQTAMDRSWESIAEQFTPLHPEDEEDYVAPLWRGVESLDNVADNFVWVFNAMENLGATKDEAPSDAAWGMLQHYRKNKKEFYGKGIDRILAIVKQRTAEETDQEPPMTIARKVIAEELAKLRGDYAAMVQGSSN